MGGSISGGEGGVYPSTLWVVGVEVRRARVHADSNYANILQAK